MDQCPSRPPAAGAQPSLPHRDAQPARGAASSAPPAGVTLGHSAAPSRPSFPIRALPKAAPRDTQPRAGRWGERGEWSPQLQVSAAPPPPTFVKETKLWSLSPAVSPTPIPSLPQRQRRQLLEAYGDYGTGTPGSNKTPEASKEHQR